MSRPAHKAPPCFDSDGQLLSYRNMQIYTGEKLPSGYCTDCLPAYQARMCAEGRCKFPETSFVVLPAGGIEGKRSRA